MATIFVDLNVKDKVRLLDGEICLISVFSFIYMPNVEAIYLYEIGT